MISQKEPQKLAVIYSRTSSDSDDDRDLSSKHSIAEQFSICRDLAKKNNYKVIGEFEDRNFSGRTEWRNHTGVGRENDEELTADYADGRGCFFNSGVVTNPLFRV